MPAKFERCVQHIKDKGQADGVNPWAVCHASTGEVTISETDEFDKLYKELVEAHLDPIQEIIDEGNRVKS